ncbi:MAG: hypothetical protein JXA71_14895 [Chitinispirillaceae bacterium]|nr:hypothetical protein [Chitinispirillaceae bacterium]
MKNLSIKFLFTALLALCFTFFGGTVLGQDEEEELAQEEQADKVMQEQMEQVLEEEEQKKEEELDLPPIDESMYSDEPAPKKVESKKEPPPDLGPEPVLEPEPDLGPEPVFSSTESDALVQNAIIEGVQLSAEPGDKEDEKVVSCYFIFRDKPSSYFYEMKKREKKIIFEFNDTRASAAPVPSTAEPPITGFTVEQRKVDINKDVRGLKPEWHTQIRVIFKLDKIPDIRVSDEYNIISFSYKWTTDPSKEDQYVVKDPTKKIMFWSGAGLATAGVSTLVWYFLRPGPKGPEEISIDDLPDRPDK